MKVRTRFAPSPTGYLHIGGVRTALFCWLFARHHDGQFVLRIDDTDKQRNVDEALGPILHGLKWLGIDWDEGPQVGGPLGPYYQSQRQDHYQAAVDQLLADGFAYHDYAKTEEIAAEREAAQARKESFIYSRKWMAETPEDRARFEAEGREAVVRLKMKREGVLVIDDLVRGKVEFAWASEQDHVIQRTDGSCLYHLASVVDDNALDITHVIRAEEHLSNTPRQIFIAQSLGYELPQYAHLPYVAEPGSKTKLSKRKLKKYLKNKDFAALMEHGLHIAQAVGLDMPEELFNPVVVDFYEQVGFLPAAVVNYLLLLGWSLDDHTEEFTREEMIRDFSLERVNKAPASFDPVKLMAFQQRYFVGLPLDERVDAVWPYAARAGFVKQDDDSQRAKVRRIVESAGDRIQVAGDIVDYGTFFQAAENLEYDEAAFEKRIRQPDDAARLLGELRDQLATLEPFDAESLEKLVKDFVEAQHIKIGNIIHALRVATTGQAVGFGMFDTLEILGRQETLDRIDRAVSHL